jgi:hypothetical protein
MPKFKADSITAQDLAEFVRSSSDFAFEMRVLNQLRDLGFDCSHSGTLVSTVPRTGAESFHDVLICRPGQTYTVFSVEPQHSAYQSGQPVGKKTDQVGRDASGALASNDEATFDKLNQAVNSCRDLVQEFALKPDEPLKRTVIPLLVVPEDLLWQVDYDTAGTITVPPRCVPHATLFYNHAWTVKDRNQYDLTYRVSHVEFATLDALPDVAGEYWGKTGILPLSGEYA